MNLDLNMRATFTVVHRWFGLITAGFLFFSGVTGAIISWDHQIDEWLNARLFVATTTKPALPGVELARIFEQRNQTGQVINLQLTPEKVGDSLSFFVMPRIDPATGRRYVLDYNQVFVDPGSGDELGRRYVGAVWPVTRENFVSFLYKLHYTMHIPEFWGSNRWGARLLGVIAIIWTIDCFVGFYLTLPSRKKNKSVRPAAVNRALERGFWARWKPAWRLKTSGSAYRITFDIHRAFSLWTWSVLLVVAFTAFSLNLNLEVFSPIMRTVSTYTQTPFEQRRPMPPDKPIVPKLSMAEIKTIAQAEGARRGWDMPVGSIFYARTYGIYAARFFKPGDDHGASGVGPPQLFYDGVDGRLLGEKLPWTGTAADIFAQAQFPMHSGRILGLPGRILISVMGLVVAALSVTGVVIWWRKRRARRSVRQKSNMMYQRFAAAE
jgi:uncharacterized iron-regulated membrane protein